MRILFIGSVLFSKSILDDIIKSKNEVIGVIGRKESKFNSDFCCAKITGKQFYNAKTLAQEKALNTVY